MIQDSTQQNPVDRTRDPDIVGAEAALRRAAVRARQRAFEKVGAVVVVIDGKLMWEWADGTFTDQPPDEPRIST